MAVYEQFFVRRLGESGEAEQAQIVPNIAREGGLADRLRRLPTDAGDAHQPVSACALELSQRFRGQPKHRLEQTDVRIANRELSRVDADCDTACSGVAVVAA